MAELGRTEKVLHLRIFTRRIKIRKFMISCCGTVTTEDLPKTGFAIQ